MISAEVLSTGLTFPDKPRVFGGFNAPVRLEADVYDLEVEGEIPAGLRGAFYRMAADHQYPPRIGADDIYINGDGMMTMIRFENGHADLRTRFVQTERFKAERAARRSLFGVYRNNFTNDASVDGIEASTANTKMEWFAGKLFALKEASRPMLIDPETLETKTWWDFDGQLRSRTFTAHPKIDPVTGEMIAYSYYGDGAITNDVELYTISPAGAIVRTERFQTPYPSMIHDFLVSRNYIVFTLCPMTSDARRIAAGGSFFYWDPSIGTKIAVIPRNEGVRGIRWFTSPKPVFMTHTINAWDDGDELAIEQFVCNSGWYSQFPHVSEANPREEPPFAERWTFDLSRDEDTFAVKVLVPHPGEMPVLDPRHTMGRARYFFFAGANFHLGPMFEFGPMGPPFNCIARYDASDESIAYYFPGNNSCTQEPVFVPKSATAREGDGWLIAVVGRHDENRSDVVILDAEHLAAGPVATLKVPFRLRFGFHGTWAPANELGWPSATPHGVSP